MTCISLTCSIKVAHSIPSCVCCWLCSKSVFLWLGMYVQCDSSIMRIMCHQHFEEAKKFEVKKKETQSNIHSNLFRVVHEFRLNCFIRCLVCCVWFWSFHSWLGVFMRIFNYHRLFIAINDLSLSHLSRIRTGEKKLISIQTVILRPNVAEVKTVLRYETEKPGP